MKKQLSDGFKSLLSVHWNPGRDLVVVLISWILVVSGLYTATKIVGADSGGGIPYFLLYAILTATIFGIGIPVVWMVAIRKRPLADLGITTRWLIPSLIIQIPLASFEVYGMLTAGRLPAFEKFMPLVALALCIGFFEAVFWRGWVLMRLEEAFGFFPAAILGSILYAAYHIGYGMPVSEMVFLFFIGLMYAIVFRATRSVFILWPVFQPIGQLITLVKDGLDLPFLATVGFLETLLVMGLIIFITNKIAKKMASRQLAQVLVHQ